MYQFQEQFHEYLQTSLKFQMNPRVVNVFSYEQWHAWWWDSMVTLSPAPSRSVHVLCLVFIIIPGTIVHCGHHDPAVTTGHWPGSRVRARVAPFTSSYLPSCPLTPLVGCVWMMNQIKSFFFRFKSPLPLKPPAKSCSIIPSEWSARGQLLWPPLPRLPIPMGGYSSKNHPNFHLI